MWKCREDLGILMQRMKWERKRCELFQDKQTQTLVELFQGERIQTNPLVKINIYREHKRGLSPVLLAGRGRHRPESDNSVFAPRGHVRLTEETDLIRPLLD